MCAYIGIRIPQSINNFNCKCNYKTNTIYSVLLLIKIKLSIYKYICKINTYLKGILLIIKIYKSI